MRVFKLIIFSAIFCVMSIAIVYANSEIVVVYNTKHLDFGDSKAINKGGSIYIPLRVFSEEVHYKVDWNQETSTARIYNAINDVYLSIDGDVKIDGKRSASDKKPLNIEGRLYIPLRFVSEALGVDVNYSVGDKVVTMYGRDIYEIEQDDLLTPKLIVYTKNGARNLGLIKDKSYLEDIMEERNKSNIYNVIRTPNSDIVEVRYVYSGALTANDVTNMYVRNGKIIAKTDLKTTAYDVKTYKEIPTKYYNNKVALLDGANYIKIYDDKTGRLEREINTLEVFGNEFDDIYKSERNGEVYNIQAVGDDFVVVNMYQPNIYAKKGSEFLMSIHYTTIINLDTLKVTPVYSHLEYFKNSKTRFDGEMRNSALLTGDVPSDEVYFDDIYKQGYLGFVGHYYYSREEKIFEDVIIKY